ncbi:hypothetical protein [Fulvivirga lutea]|uniref:Uncharacterized protein n=1 Tax=Fulvivirga lutea TaxID=2810512 RepID=A0A974WKV7_9BACT|nr:hypothetical protein [Fulvivirga lutea]QSE97233.1 hypothetical protein JR347_16825 [Fulvivirga lutea]
MLIQVFNLRNRQIEVRWNDLEMQIYERGAIVKKISNSDNLNGYKTVLHDGSELQIQFRFATAHSSLNLYLNGELMEGSSSNSTNRIKFYPLIFNIVGFAFLIIGIGYAFNNSFISEKNAIVSFIDISIGAFILISSGQFQKTNFTWFHLLTRTLLIIALISSYFLLRDLFYQSLLIIFSFILTLVAVSDYKKAGNMA